MTTTSPPRRIAPSRLTGLRGSVPRWFISCRNAGPTFRVLPSFLPSFLVSRAGQLPSFLSSLSPFTSPLETSLGGGYFTQSTVRPRISTKSLFWIRFLPPFPIPHVSAALLANLNFFYHKTPLLTRNIRVSRKLKGIRKEMSYEKAFRKGRKGLRVTGPMITRARISKRDMPLILSLSRERGAAFSWPRYPLQGITNWRWSRSPRFAELLADARKQWQRHELKEELCDRMEGWGGK